MPLFKPRNALGMVITTKDKLFSCKTCCQWYLLWLRENSQLRKFSILKYYSGKHFNGMTLFCHLHNRVFVRVSHINVYYSVTLIPPLQLSCGFLEEPKSILQDSHFSCGTSWKKIDFISILTG